MCSTNLKVQSVVWFLRRDPNLQLCGVVHALGDVGGREHVEEEDVGLGIDRLGGIGVTHAARDIRVGRGQNLQRRLRNVIETSTLGIGAL